MFQDDTTGLRFGNFEVLVRPDGSINELGRGGFGRTLLARHSLLHTRVALKIIDERHARDEAARSRFLKEAREQARLTHPGIARITDCGQVDGQLYYAVELCPDGHLREFVSRAGPLNVPDTFHLLLQAAEALDYSHRSGVVHLDVKPSNLMLVFDKDGFPQVKLIDFGLVQQPAAEASPGGHTGEPLFSAPFASPEQIRSRPTDGRSDIFSLGMTGWYLLTGHNPVEGAAEVVIGERLSAAEYEPSLPPQLTGKPRAVLARMIRKNSDDRYDNSADLLADLRACLKTMPKIAGGWQHRRRSSGALADRFMLEKGTQARQGTVHYATDRETRQRVKVTLIRSMTMSQTVAQYHKVREIMSGMEGSGLLRVLEVQEFNEGWAVVEEASGGVSLTETLRGEGALPLSRYAPLVWQLGSAMDTAFSAGLTNVLLDEAVVDLPPGGGRSGIDWAGVTVRMPLAAGTPGQAAAQDRDATMSGDFTRTGVSGAGVQLLARWVYFIVGGKNPPNSALFSIKEYIAIPGLGDQGNQILARHLCGQSAPSLCQDMLRPLFAAEGLSWEGVGEKMRQARWGAVLQESGAVIEEIETTVTAAEKLVAACEPFAALVPEEVKRCYADASLVYEAGTAARAHQTQLSQGGDRSTSAGQTVLAALREISTQARVSLQRAEAEFREARAAVEKVHQLAEERERRRKDLVESIAGAWRRTREAAKEAGDFADECSRIAPDLPEAKQLESLATQSAGLAAQLKALHDEAAAAPESQWDHIEQQIPHARQVATDAREMARDCRPLLEKAKAGIRRREEEARRREVARAALTDAVRQAQQTAAEAPPLVNGITAAAENYPELHDASRSASADGVRIAAIEQNVQSFLTASDAGAAELEQAQQQVTTAGDEIRSLVKRLQSALQQARQTAGELSLRAEKFAAAAASLTELAAAAVSTAAAAVEKSGNHGFVAGQGTPAAACLAKASAAAVEATSCQDQIAALRASLDPRGMADPDRTVAEARQLAAECDRQAAETARHLREAEYYILEAQRQAQLEEEAARAKAAAAIAEAMSQVDREIKRAREAFTRAGQHAEVASAAAAVTRASEAWSATQARQRQVRQWKSTRPPEAASNEDFLQLLSGAVRDLTTFAENAERALAEATAAAQEAAREAGSRKQQELEASRRRADEERLQREEEARRKAAEEEARRQVLLAAQREQEEQARRLADAEEMRRQAVLAEQRRIEQEVRVKAEAEAAEICRRDEEVRRKAEWEAADLRKLEALARRQDEAAAAEKQRKEEEARRQAEAIVAEARRLEEDAKRKVEVEAAERRRQEEEARRIAEEAELRRKEQIAADLQREAEARRAAELEEQGRRDAEEKRRKEEEADRQRQEAEAKREADAAEKRRLAAEVARLKQEADAKRKAEAGAKRIADAEEKRRQAEIAAQLKQEADAKRKAEAEAKRIADAEEKRRQAEAAAKLKQEAEAKRIAEAEKKRRQAEITAQLKLEADTKRKAEAEAVQLKQEAGATRKAEADAKATAESGEKRRQAEVAAELKRVSEARQKSAAEQERQQAEIRRQEMETKRQAEAVAAVTVVPRPDGWAPPRRSKAPLVAAAALVIIGGGAAAWWAMNRKDHPTPSPSPTAPEVVEVKPPSDPPPPPPATYTTSITLSGDVLTKGLASMKDITLSGHDPAATTIRDDGIQFKTVAGNASRTVTLASTRKGIKLDPATLVIRGDGDSQQDVTLSRETGRVAFKAPPPAAPSFYARAILHWDRDTTFATPGTVEHTVDLTKQTVAELPTGPWLVTVDDDEPEDGKPGKSGAIVDARKFGTAEIKEGQTAPAISLPEGMPPLLYSEMDWQTQESGGEETVRAQLQKMLADVRFPGGPPDVSAVINGLARTASLPLLSYPLYLAQKDGKFFILRPQRKDFLILMNLGIDRLAMAAAIIKVLDLKVDPDSLNPAAGIAPGTRVPWRAVSESLAAARDALARSENKVVQELHAEIISSLSILRLILHDDWTVSPADIATWVSAWKESTEPCSAVRIHSDGGIALSFKMSDVSTRTLVIKAPENGQYPVTMPAGPGPDEKDTFSGRFKPAPQLPPPLAGKLPE